LGVSLGWAGAGFQSVLKLVPQSPWDSLFEERLEIVNCCLEHV